uniref:C-type lectin domain-containing protein n=1 Tax=Amphiprion percula TaxID=161767 RepID=A0A3P8TEX0_AMPPE
MDHFSWLISSFLSQWFILPSCPLHQYHFVKEPLTWDEAQTYCRERFTDLASIDNMTEMNQLIDTVSSTGYNSDVWIGLYAEIEWFWADGIDAEYRNWEDGEPNFSIGQYCVSTRRAAKWMHIKCEISCPFICNNVLIYEQTFTIMGLVSQKRFQGCHISPFFMCLSKQQ